jgi:hypothetical protein
LEVAANLCGVSNQKITIRMHNRKKILLTAVKYTREIRELNISGGKFGCMLRWSLSKPLSSLCKLFIE